MSEIKIQKKNICTLPSPQEIPTEAELMKVYEKIKQMFYFASKEEWLKWANAQLDTKIKRVDHQNS